MLNHSNFFLLLLVKESLLVLEILETSITLG